MAKKVSFGTTPQKVTPVAASADQWVDTRINTETNKRLTIDLPESLHRRIKTQCAARGVKMVDVIREMLEEKFPEK
jgi:predicted DNA binding CopG/RHH family protein